MSLINNHSRNLDFTELQYDAVAMASVGPYANHLHLTPDK